MWVNCNIIHLVHSAHSHAYIPTYAHTKITSYPWTQPSCMFQRNRHSQDISTKEHTTQVHEFYMYNVKSFLTLQVKFMYWYYVFLCTDILRMVISLKHAGGLCSWITCNFIMCICWYYVSELLSFPVVKFNLIMVPIQQCKSTKKCHSYFQLFRLLYLQM